MVSDFIRFYTLVSLNYSCNLLSMISFRIWWRTLSEKYLLFSSRLENSAYYTWIITVCFYTRLFPSIYHFIYFSIYVNSLFLFICACMCVCACACVLLCERYTIIHVSSCPHAYINWCIWKHANTYWYRFRYCSTIYLYFFPV